MESDRQHRIRIGALVGGCLLVGVSLTACGQIAEQATEKVLEQAAEQAGGGNVDLDLDSGSVTVQGDDGNIAIGSDLALPETWPADVPAYDGGSLISVLEGQGGATGMWQVQAAVTDVAAQYRATLQGAGYTIVEGMATDALVSFSGSTSATRVDVTVAGDGGAGSTITITSSAAQ